MAQTGFSKILTYKSDTATTVPAAGDLTNGAGGAELAVNTADKRLFTKDSGGNVVELGTNPSSITLPNGTANGVVYANGSKVLTTGSALTFDGTNLGIGTSSPSNKLDIVGSVGIKSAGSLKLYNAANSSTSELSSDATGLTQFSHTGVTRWLNATATTELMRLTSTGLGIGTSSPSVRLQLEQAANSAPVTLLRLNNSGTTSGGPGIASRVSFTAGATSLGYIQGSNFASGAVGLQFSGDGTNTQATLDSSGNVGIGTSSPITKLEVSGSGTATSNLGVTIQGTDNASYGQYLQFRRNGNNSLIIGDAGSILGSGGGNAVYYSYGTNYQAWFTNGEERMRIDSSGNVGIGTSSPVAKLTVSGVGTGAWITLNRTDSGTNIVDFTASGSRIGYVGAIANDMHVLQATANNVVFSTNNIERMRIDSSGNLLVGTTGNPIANCRFRAAATGDWSFGPYQGGTEFLIYNTSSVGVYLSNGAQSWTGSSDERLKTDLTPIEDAANKVASLRAVIGRFKTDKEGTKRSFLIAQDVQKVLPEAVNVVPGTDDTLGVAYTDVIPLLVAAIKELKAELDATKAEVAALKSTN